MTHPAPELLAPAGNLEKLKAAVMFGADAVYFAGSGLSLRAATGAFDAGGMKQALDWLHERGKKGYVTLNAYARNDELADAATIAAAASDAGADALIVSDPGVFAIARQAAPDTPIHISTQANTTNRAAASFWKNAGAGRVILARELSGAEIAGVAESGIETEVFVHGAMCMSMSGRCLLSSYFTGRDANRGACTHPCRWKYAIVEESRPGVYLPVEEDEGGAYIMNAKDLCLIDRLGELIRAGVTSMKIEGRMKSVMYVAVVTAVYRAAIDAAMKDPEGYRADPAHLRLLASVSHRGYTEGFYAGKGAGDEAMEYATSGYIRNADFLGVVESADAEGMTVNVRGKFVPGETVSVFQPGAAEADIVVSSITEEDGAVEAARPNAHVSIPGDFSHIPAGSLLRRYTDEHAKDTEA